MPLGVGGARRPGARARASCPTTCSRGPTRATRPAPGCSPTSRRHADRASSPSCPRRGARRGACGRCAPGPRATSARWRRACSRPTAARATAGSSRGRRRRAARPPSPAASRAPGLLRRARAVGDGGLPRGAVERRSGGVRLRALLRLPSPRIRPAGGGDDRSPSSRVPVRIVESMIGPADLPILQRTIELAERRTRPGLAQPARRRRGRSRDGQILGRGLARRATAATHAEVARSRAAGDAAAGATLYVSLEPCAHQGKTPPCTDAIVAAGIAARRRRLRRSRPRRPRAAGLGILRDEGVEVDVADGDAGRRRARLLNQPFRKHARTGPAVGALQVGDDRSTARSPPRPATRSGSPASRVAQAGPPLARPSPTPSPSGSARRWPTTRSSPPGSTTAPRQPRRVVFDSTARLPLDSRLVRAAAEIPLTVVASRAAPRGRRSARSRPPAPR